jgi:hypothetical protein
MLFSVVCSVCKKKVDSLKQKMEREWQEMKADVFNQLDLQHPLMFKETNLCQLAKTNGIGKLKMKCLKDICEHFNIEVSGPKTTKETFVLPLIDFILKCKCT